MRDFTFKPALLRGAVTYRVHPDRIERMDDGESIAYADLTRARYVSHIVRHHEMDRLDLHAGERLFRISRNHPHGTAADDPDQDGFRATLLAVAEQLEETNPTLPIALGESGKSGGAMFALGVMSILGAAGMLIGAIVGGVSENRLLEGAVPIGTLALFGGYLAHSFRPWRAQLTLPPTLLVQVLRSAFDQSEQAVDDNPSA